MPRITGTVDARFVVMQVPPVSHYMSTNPKVVSPHQTMSAAWDLMHRYKIRHMPVLDRRTVVGLISDGRRDLYVVDDRVAEAMDTEVDEVGGDTPLSEVVALMYAKHAGAVIVTGDDGLEGILTRSDVLKAFCDLVRPTGRS